MHLVGWLLLFIYMRTTPTHYYLESSGQATYMGINIKKHKSTHSLFGAWSFLLVHLGLHLVRGHKRLCKLIFIIKKIQTMKVGPSSRTMEKCHLPWSNVMVHGVNQP